jgi:ribosomal protein S18 acetylase RimI-like enzyme
MNYHITRFNHSNQNWLKVVLSLRAEFGDKDSPEPFASFVKRRLEDESMLLALAWVDENPVGYGLAFDVAQHPFMPEWTRAGYITQFLVSRNYRQRGVGKILMDYINDWFQSRGLQKVLLNVDIENEAGIRFWEIQGFEAYAMRMKRAHVKNKE